jgi:hypothetical protein
VIIETLEDSWIGASLRHLEVRMRMIRRASSGTFRMRQTRKNANGGRDCRHSAPRFYLVTGNRRVDFLRIYSVETAKVAVRSEEFILSCRELSKTNAVVNEEICFVVDGRGIKCTVFQMLPISSAFECLMKSGNMIINLK